MAHILRKALSSLRRDTRWSAVAAALVCTTTVASSFVTNVKEQHPPYSQHRRFAPLLPLAQCSKGQQEDDSSPYYKRMETPPRAKATSHVIYGHLLQPELVERYHVYHRVPKEENELVVAHVQLGTNLDGHEGVVHGGVLSLLLDDVMGYAYEALGVSRAVTASLNVDFRAPVPAGAPILIRVHLSQRQGRKLYFDAKITNPEESVLYAEATSLYIIPREHYKDDESENEGSNEDQAAAA